MAIMHTDPSHSMQNLAGRWHEAAKKDIGTTERMKLYEDTAKVVEFLGRGVKQANPEEMKAINDLCQALIQGFNQSDESNKRLSEWVAHNTSHTEQRTWTKLPQFSGAYEPLHNLFEALGKQRISSQEHAAIKAIDSKSLENIKSLKQGTPKESIEMLFYSRVSIPDLVQMASTTKENKAVILPLLIDKVNRGEISLNDLGIHTVSGLINFFGDHCEKITTLDLRDLKGVKDEDFEKIAIHFPDITKLSVNSKYLTNNCLLSIAEMPLLTTLDLSGCTGIKDSSVKDQMLRPDLWGKFAYEYMASGESKIDLSLLGNCPRLTTLNLAGCTGVKDFSFLAKCPSINTLDLSQCPEIDNLNFLQSCPSVKSLNLAGCINIKDASGLQNCTLIENLNIEGCSQLEELNLAENIRLKNLNLAGCGELTELSLPKNSPSLTSLNLADCAKLGKLELPQNLSSFKSLNMAGCLNIQDFKFLEKCHNIEDLNLSKCVNFNDLNLVENCLLLKNLNVGECNNINDASPLVQCSKLEHLNLHQTNIGDIDFLFNLPVLRSLNLSECTNTLNFTHVTRCPLLTDLNLSKCDQILDYSFLEGCKSLTVLDLSNCEQIRDFSFLEKCTSLTDLSFRNLKIPVFTLMRSPSVKTFDISGFESTNETGTLGISYMKNNFPALEKLIITTRKSHFPADDIILLSVQGVQVVP